MSELSDELNDRLEPSLSEVACVIGQVIDLSDGTKGMVTKIPTPDSPYVHAHVTDLPFVRDITYVFREGTVDQIRPIAFGKSLCPSFYETLGTQIMELQDLKPQTA